MRSTDAPIETVTVTFPKASIVEGTFTDVDYVELRVYTPAMGTFCVPVHRQFISRQSLPTPDEVLENAGTKLVCVKLTDGREFRGCVKSWNDTTATFWIENGTVPYQVTRSLIENVREVETEKEGETESAARPIHSERSGITYSPMAGHITDIDICDKCGMLVHYAHRKDHDTFHVLVANVLSAGRSVWRYLDIQNAE